MGFAWTIVAMIVVLAIAWRYLGAYMVSVYEGRTRWLSFIERPIYKIAGIDPEAENRTSESERGGKDRGDDYCHGFKRNSWTRRDTRWEHNAECLASWKGAGCCRSCFLCVEHLGS